jgi:5'-3' exonuclease
MRFLTTGLRADFLFPIKKEMGIKHLTPLLKRFAPSSITHPSRHVYHGKKVTVDAELYMRRFLYGDVVHPFSHVQGFVQFCEMTRRYGIIPVFVFDGNKRDPAKLKEMERRRKLKGRAEVGLRNAREMLARVHTLTEMAEMYKDNVDAAAWMERVIQEGKTNGVDGTFTRLVESVKGQQKEGLTRTQKFLQKWELNLLTELPRRLHLPDLYDSFMESLQRLEAQVHNLCVSLEKRTVTVDRSYAVDVRSVLERMGMPVIVNDTLVEAEALCAKMVMDGLVHATVSEDLDVAAFGDGLLLRHFFTNTPVMQIDPLQARKELGFTRRQFIDMCILCGTDFCEKLPGIGHVRAVGLIRQHGTIEEVVKVQGLQMSEEWMKEVERARTIFDNDVDLTKMGITPDSLRPTEPDENWRDMLACEYEIEF